MRNERKQWEKWSGQQDSNLRPSAPKENGLVPKTSETRPGLKLLPQFSPVGQVIVLSATRFTRVDESDYRWLSVFAWRVREGYVIRSSDDLRMHRVIMDAKPGQIVDHINGDPLDNRRSNLRICTQQGNQWNRRKTKNPTSSKFKGVWFAKNHAHTARPWRAQIKVGKVRYLGSFATEIEAAQAYDRAATEHFGEFACLNFSPLEPVRSEPGSGR